MAVGERSLLIQTGDRLPASKAGKIYGLPVAFKGFENLSLARVALNDRADIETLIPDYNYDAKHQANYRPFEAVCVSEAGEPVLALVIGEDIYVSSQRGEDGKYRDVTERSPMRTIVNLSRSQEDVTLFSSKTYSLKNNNAYWPGYTLTLHEKFLEAGQETLVVEKHGDKFTISFSESGSQWR